LGPHVQARPMQEGGGGTQTFVVVLQLGVVSVQSASDKQATHCDIVPRSLHFGVSPPHTPQLAPQRESALHVVEHTPAPTHAWFLPQRVLMGV
ncbi:MAG: hypothetical protein ABIQ16_24230, partial [Polyangiaceae bacterium]